MLHWLAGPVPVQPPQHRRVSALSRAGAASGCRGSSPSRRTARLWADAFGPFGRPLARCLGASLRLVATRSWCVQRASSPERGGREPAPLQTIPKLAVLRDGAAKPGRTHRPGVALLGDLFPLHTQFVEQPQPRAPGNGGGDLRAEKRASWPSTWPQDRPPPT